MTVLLTADACGLTAYCCGLTADACGLTADYPIAWLPLFRVLRVLRG